MDTMCGWCYGFSDVINTIHERYKTHLDFMILPAGMWTGDNVKVMDPKLRDFIEYHNPAVTNLTGKVFGDEYKKNILQNNGFALDSLPGAKALTVMQALKKEKTFEYLKEIQSAFYVHGKDTNDWRLYARIAESFGISEDVFKNEYFSDMQEKAVNDCFTFVQQLGVASYPSVVAVVEGKSEIIAQGYLELDELDTMIRSYI